MVEREFLSIREVCVMLGMGEKTVKGYIRKGWLKAYKPQKKLLVAKADLNQFLASSAVIPKVS